MITAVTSTGQTVAPPVTTGGQTTSPPSTDPVAEAAAIRSAFETFFGGAATTIDAKVAVLQDGERYRSMIVDAAANAQFQAMTIDIRELVIGDPARCAALGVTDPCATVTFDLLVSRMPALVAQPGTAVQIDGRWLVASSAWCAVVAIGGESCP